MLMSAVAAMPAATPAAAANTTIAISSRYINTTNCSLLTLQLVVAMELAVDNVIVVVVWCQW
jgi:hypothetical protein